MQGLSPLLRRARPTGAVGPPMGPSGAHAPTAPRSGLPQGPASIRPVLEPPAPRPVQGPRGQVPSSRLPSQGPTGQGSSVRPPEYPTMHYVQLGQPGQQSQVTISPASWQRPPGPATNLTANFAPAVGAHPSQQAPSQQHGRGASLPAATGSGSGLGSHGPSARSAARDWTPVGASAAGGDGGVRPMSIARAPGPNPGPKAGPPAPRPQGQLRQQQGQHDQGISPVPPKLQGLLRGSAGSAGGQSDDLGGAGGRRSGSGRGHDPRTAGRGSAGGLGGRSGQAAAEQGRGGFEQGSIPLHGAAGASGHGRLAEDQVGQGWRTIGHGGPQTEYQGEAPSARQQPAQAQLPPAAGATGEQQARVYGRPSDQVSTALSCRHRKERVLLVDRTVYCPECPSGLGIEAALLRGVCTVSAASTLITCAYICMPTPNCPFPAMELC